MTDVPAGDRENLCRRCGVCCHEKVRFGDQVVITDIPCPFLDEETNLCAVYPDRFEKQPRCSSADQSAGVNGLPGDCPYVADRKNYRAPHLLSAHPEYEQAINALYPDRAGKKRAGK
ncbi:MAG: hypothetical protein LBT97_10285 [Planctomycetota bacterium]|nr:hypothetical protein [Planctomycetota bacterium]